MIINTSYYRSGSLHIPNHDVTTRTRNGEQSQANDLQAFIDTNERVYLIRTLNADLWNAITGSLDQTGAVEDAAPQWVKYLLNGYTYEIEGVKRVWDGLKHPQSCLVYYVFTKWFEDNQYANLQAGLSQLKDNGSMRVNPSDFHQTQWNTFVYKHQGERDFNQLPQVYEYTHGTLIDYMPSNQKDGFASLLQYLEDYETLFPETFENLNTRTYERINSFGL